VTDDELIAVMRDADGPAWTTGEIASHVDMSTEGVRNRLESLAAEGRLNRKQPQRQTVLWWLTENEYAPVEASA